MAIVGIFAFKSPLFKACAAVTYIAVAWLCIQSIFIPELRELLKSAARGTMRLTAMVIFILVGSNCFTVVFQGFDGGRWPHGILTSLPGGIWGFLIFVNLFVFFIAFFLDFFEIAFIIVPLLAPVAKVILEEVKSSDIYWGALPWVAMQLMLVALVIKFPEQVTMFLDKPQHVDLDKVKIELPDTNYETELPDFSKKP